MGTTNQEYRYQSMSIETATADKDIKADITGLFDELSNVWYVKIESTKAISVKVNFSSNDTLPIAANWELVIWEYFLPIRSISNLYVTNASWDTATVEITIAGEALATNKI